MDIVLWIIAGLLAAVFALVGFGKLTQPKDKLRENPNMAWVEDFSPAVLKLIGAAELAGAVGLILPAATGIATFLTPLAATGLAVTMVLAAVVHLRRGEAKALPVNAVLAALAIVVAWGRFGPYAF